MAYDLDAIRTRGLDHLRAAFGEEAVTRAVEVASRFTLDIPAWQFWEGSMRVSGEMDGEEVSGNGYAELVRFPSIGE